jgi:hypothetical protein
VVFAARSAQGRPKPSVVTLSMENFPLDFFGKFSIVDIG